MPSNIIGTGPNQVPTNADLGTMAYQDSNAVKVKDITFNDGSSQQTAASGFGFKNRIINGDMRIDQRNAGASVTPTTDTYTLDRWRFGISQSSKFSTQQNAGGVTPPVGFKNYLGVTSLSAYNITSTDIFGLYQRIEGFNVADLAWGTANAATVTLSFQVYSSLTGTFGGSLQNNAGNRTYPFTYTISAANTWTPIAVTIPGDTTGTWLTDNSTGIKVAFGLGLGSTVTAAAGAWNGTSGLWGANGCVSVVGTNGATFYITGVQLEKGSTATSFDYRPYGTELALCYRYYRRYIGGNQMIGTGAYRDANTVWRWGFPLDIAMRAAPTIALNSCVAWGGGNLGGTTTVAASYTGTNIIDCDLATSGMPAATTYTVAKMYIGGASPYIELTAEL